MANNDFSKIQQRNHSLIVSQIAKQINYYGSVFCSRTRVYINKLSQSKNSIYWIDNNLKLTALAIVDPNYKFSVNNVTLQTIGHIIATVPGQIDRVIKHIFEDYKEESFMLLCKPFVAESLKLYQDFNLLPILPSQLLQFWPDLANIKTDYFNVKNEVFYSGLERKNHNIYLKLTQKDKEILKKNKVKIDKLKYTENVTS
jgi:hypothetical protein